MPFPILPWELFQKPEQKPDEHFNGDGYTPLHRTYGVKRRVHPWREKAASLASQIFLIWVTFLLILAGSTGLVMLWLYFPELWVKLLITITIAAILFVRLTRTVRRRRKFCRKLRRLCKKQKYEMRYEQNFFQSLFWSSDRQDFRLETERAIYYVRYLTVRKRRSSLYIESANLLRLLKRPLQNIFTVILNFKPTNKYYPLDFQIPSEQTEKQIVKALIVNPVCEEMFYKRREGGYEVTGNRGEHFGFTVFTGSGFIDTVKRDGEQ